MKTIQVTEYIANDGRIFREVDKCLAYETELRAVVTIMREFPKAPKANGAYIEFDAERLRQFKRLLWALIVVKYGDSWPKWRKWDADDVHPSSIVGRVLSDASNYPLERAWNRFLSCDFDLGRVYDQPYFVSHPNEAKLSGEAE